MIKTLRSNVNKVSVLKRDGYPTGEIFVKETFNREISLLTSTLHID